MKNITIKAAKRTETGKKFTKKIRKEGLVPCVLYGGEKNELFTVSEKELKKIIYTDKVYLINLDIDGEIHTCIKKAAQFHPVTDITLHVDFLKTTEDKPVKLFLPVTLTGFAKGIQEGGNLFKMKRYLNIKGLMQHIPDDIEIDVTELSLGKTIKVSELKIENIEILEPPTDVVAMVKLTRAAMSMAEEGTEEETEEGAEGTEEEKETKE